MGAAAPDPAAAAAAPNGPADVLVIVFVPGAVPIGVADTCERREEEKEVEPLAAGECGKEELLPCEESLTAEENEPAWE